MGGGGGVKNSVEGNMVLPHYEPGLKKKKCRGHNQLINLTTSGGSFPLRGLYFQLTLSPSVFPAISSLRRVVQLYWLL